MRLRFSQFVFDTDRHELWRGSEPVRLTPKAYRLLQVLVENRPKALAQKELYDLLWPDTFVDRSNIHNLIYQLREALDDGGQEIIRTVYGFGFAFAAAAIEEAPKACSWTMIVGALQFDLKDGENIVGREKDVTVRIDDPSVSRHHARLVISAGAVSLEDLGSKNGTSVHGRRVHALERLADGDTVVFGTVAATLRADRGATSTQTASVP